MGFKRQRVETEQFDTRETDALDPTADLSLLRARACELCGDPRRRSAIRRKRHFPKLKEYFPANNDPFNMFAYSFKVQAKRAREAFILDGN